MVSREMKSVIKGLLYGRNLEIKGRVENTRKGLELMTKGIKLPEDVETSSVDINGVSAVWFKTPNARSDKVILFFHGGAYIAGSPDSSKVHTVYISRLSEAQCLSVDYRLAPEHPFPAALEDAIKAYKWLIEEKEYSAKNIIIVGVSAGGGLTIATLLKLRELGMELPSAAVCISPWTDLAFTGKTFKTRAKIDPFTSPNGLDFAADLYVGEYDSKNPFLSPVYANHQGLPPLFIIAGTAEILYDDSVRLAENAKKAGVDVTLDIWDDMIHAFPVFVNIAPESQEAMERIAEFIRKHFK
jgi:acetyl esterase/lipase